jgi:tripartite-type tricarboxylate transporter receptor subunit TctC
MRRRFLMTTAAMGAMTALLPFAARAQTYPSKPIRLVVTFAPGGGADYVGRSIAQPLSEALGQTVVVDNRAGANGVVGADIGAKSAPDGYTLLLGAAGTLSVAPHLGEPLPFDPVRDLEPVTLVATGPFVLTVTKALPVDSVASLIAYARANPGKLNFGSSGKGGAPHLATELFASMAGIKMVHVPYRGLGPAVADLISGQIQVLFADVPLVAEQAKAGTLRALAISSLTRSSVVPDLPPVAEAGVPGYSAGTWYGLFLPAHTPPAIVDKIGGAMKTVLAAPALRAAMSKQGAEAQWMTPDAFAGYVRDDSAKWGKLIKDLGIKVE